MNHTQRDTDGRRQKTAGGSIGMPVRGVAAGIGLISESYNHYKEKKASQNPLRKDEENAAVETQERREWQHDAYLLRQTDDAAWELDEAQDQVSQHRPRPAAANDAEIPDPGGSFLVAHARRPPYPTGQLGLPVVITQQRPESRTKGFVRAYSPFSTR